MSREEQNRRNKHAKYRKSIGDPFLVPVGPVAGKLWELRKTMLLREIQDATGVSYHQLTKFTRPGRRTLPVEQARAIMSCQAPAPGPTAAERRVGARRILQGLCALGFTGRSMSAETGLAENTMRHLRNNPAPDRRTNVSISPESYARLVRAAQKLETQKPTDLGVSVTTMRGVIARSRNKGYAPLTVWDLDTVHDPQEIPEWTGACGSLVGFRVHRREDIPLCQPCKEAARDYGGEYLSFSPEKFAVIRLGAGYTIRGLERAIGASQGTVSHWEHRNSAPQPKYLQEAMSVLDCTFEDISD